MSTFLDEIRSAADVEEFCSQDSRSRGLPDFRDWGDAVPEYSRTWPVVQLGYTLRFRRNAPVSDAVDDMVAALRKKEGAGLILVTRSIGFH